MPECSQTGATARELRQQLPRHSPHNLEIPRPQTSLKSGSLEMPRQAAKLSSPRLDLTGTVAEIRALPSGSRANRSRPGGASSKRTAVRPTCSKTMGRPSDRGCGLGLVRRPLRRQHGLGKAFTPPIARIESAVRSPVPAAPAAPNVRRHREDGIRPYASKRSCAFCQRRLAFDRRPNRFCPR